MTTHERFCIWARGFIEAVGDNGLNKEQLQTIKARLDEVEDKMIQNQGNLGIPRKIISKTPLELAQERVRMGEAIENPPSPGFVLGEDPETI